MTDSFGSKAYVNSGENSIFAAVKRSYADRLSPGSEALRSYSRLHNPEGCCTWCGRKSEHGVEAHPTDHVIPVAYGGMAFPGCMAVICSSCNSAKGALHPLEYWRERKASGKSLWIEAEAEFKLWLHSYMAPFLAVVESSHVRAYALSDSVDEQTMNLLKKDLSGIWTNHAKTVFDGVVEHDFSSWFSKESEQVAPAKYWSHPNVKKVEAGCAELSESRRKASVNEARRYVHAADLRGEIAALSEAVTRFAVVGATEKSDMRRAFKFMDVAVDFPVTPKKIRANRQVLPRKTFSPQIQQSKPSKAQERASRSELAVLVKMHRGTLSESNFASVLRYGESFRALEAEIGFAHAAREYSQKALLMKDRKEACLIRKVLVAFGVEPEKHSGTKSLFA